jgi:hypothetical protein
MKLMMNRGKKYYGPGKSLMTFSFCLLFFVFMQSPARGQADPAPPATPAVTPRPMPRVTPARPAVPHPTGLSVPGQVRPDPKNPVPVRNTLMGPAERTIEVENKVNISLCVTGPLKVNGSDRNEVRAFVDGGSSVGFRILQLNKGNKKVTGLQVLGFDPQTNKEINLDECLQGSNIELDVPIGAVLNIKSKQSEMSIDSVSRVRIDNVSGGIALSNITMSAQATTFEGDITLENAKGPVNLETTVGKIIVFGAAPNDIGEIFRAKSRSGAIALQDVEHTDVNLSSNSGSLRFNGELGLGGRYNFNTTSGSIVLILPPDTSSKIIANYGGSFETQITFKDIQKFGESTVQKVIALLGAGESTVNVTTYNGSILIKPIKK